MNYITATSSGITSLYSSAKAKLQTNADLRIKLLAGGVLLSSLFLSCFSTEESRPYDALQLTGSLTLFAAVLNKLDKKEKVLTKLDLPNRQNAILKQMIKESKPEGVDDRKTIFLAMSKDTFPLENYDCQENIRRLSSQYKIEWIRATTFSDITAAMKKVKTISHLILATDGNEDRLTLADKALTNQRIIKYCFDANTFPNLDPKASILLLSPSAAKEDGIGQYFSEVFPEATIFGAIGRTDPNATWIHLDPNNAPTLCQLNTKQKNITRIYKNQIQYSHSDQAVRKILNERNADFSLD